MRVLVLGAGVIGVTTAYALARDGHQVTVLEREQAAGLGTSYANAGNLTPGAAAPWAAPGLPFQLLKWMSGEDAAVQFRLQANPRFIHWLLASLLECLPSAYATNKAALTRAAYESLAALDDIRGVTGIAFDHGAGAAIRIISGERDFEAAARGVSGPAFEVLDRGQVLAAEPGLARSAIPIAGGIRLTEDETGDCHLFTRALADWLAGQGVDFRFGVTATRLVVEDRKIREVITDQGVFKADAVVVANGVWSPTLLRSAGIRLPIIPIKGYSLTAPVLDADAAPRSTITYDNRRIVVTRLGDRIRVAGIAEFAGFDTSLPQKQTSKLVRAVNDLFPGAADIERAEYWAGFRPATPSGLPVIGRTRLGNLFLNAGHGPLGWTLAAGSANRLARAFAHIKQ